jgi:hypothetical protein
MPGLYSDCNCPILNTVGILYQNSIVVYLLFSRRILDEPHPHSPYWKVSALLVTALSCRVLATTFISEYEYVDAEFVHLLIGPAL